MDSLTRAEMRERVRHNLSKRTARDENANNNVGDPASTHPHPSNSFLNEKIDEALRTINAECRLGHVQDIEVSVAATTSDGAQRVKLRTVTGETPEGLRTGFGDINVVKRAYLEVGTSLYPLTPIDREEYDRSRRRWEEEDAGTPRHYWLEGTDLYLLPGTDSAATLHLMVGTGVIGFSGDADTLLQLPNDYHPVIVDLATQLVAESQQLDTEMASFAALYHAKVWGAGNSQDRGGIERIRQWKRGQTAELQASLHVRTGRYSVGRRG